MIYSKDTYFVLSMLKVFFSDMVNTQMNNIDTFPKLMKIQWTNKKENILYIPDVILYYICYMPHVI